MGRRRKNRYYDSLDTVKGSQHMTNLGKSSVHKWDVEENHVSDHGSKVNKRGKARIGFVERVRRRCGY